MNKTNHFEDILEKYRKLIENAKNDPKFRTRLANFGMYEPTLRKGERLYEETVEILKASKNTDYHKLTVKILILRETVESEYRMVKSKVRELLEMHPFILSIVPLYDIPNKLAECKSGIRRFYNSLLSNDALMYKMGELGMDDYYVIDRLANLDELDLLVAQREAKYMQLSDIIVAQEGKIEQLKEFCNNVGRIANNAYNEKPEMKEKLGIAAFN